MIITVGCDERKTRLLRVSSTCFVWYRQISKMKTWGFSERKKKKQDIFNNGPSNSFSRRLVIFSFSLSVSLSFSCSFYFKLKKKTKSIPPPPPLAVARWPRRRLFLRAASVLCKVASLTIRATTDEREKKMLIISESRRHVRNNAKGLYGHEKPVVPTGRPVDNRTSTDKVLGDYVIRICVANSNPRHRFDSKTRDETTIAPRLFNQLVKRSLLLIFISYFPKRKKRKNQKK